MDHVYKGKSDTALSLEVFRKIKIVVLSLKFNVHQVHHFCLSKLDRYVADHQSSKFQYFIVSPITTVKNPLKVNLVILRSYQHLPWLWLALLAYV
jgi:hypothetical protein